MLIKNSVTGKLINFFFYWVTFFILNRKNKILLKKTAPSMIRSPLTLYCDSNALSLLTSFIWLLISAIVLRNFCSESPSEMNNIDKSLKVISISSYYVFKSSIFVIIQIKLLIFFLIIETMCSLKCD